MADMILLSCSLWLTSSYSDFSQLDDWKRIATKKTVGARNNEDLFQKDSFSWDILFPFLFLQTFSLFSLGQLRDYDRNSKLTPYSLYTSTFKPHLDKKLVNSNCICGNGAIYAIRRSRSWVGWNSVGYRTKLVLCFWYEIQLVFIVL